MRVAARHPSEMPVSIRVMRLHPMTKVDKSKQEKLVSWTCLVCLRLKTNAPDLPRLVNSPSNHTPTSPYRWLELRDVSRQSGRRHRHMSWRTRAAWRRPSSQSSPGKRHPSGNLKRRQASPPPSVHDHHRPRPRDRLPSFPFPCGYRSGVDAPGLSRVGGPHHPQGSTTETMANGWLVGGGSAPNHRCETRADIASLHVVGSQRSRPLY